MKETFILKNLKHEETPIHLNTDIGIIEYYDDYNEEYITIKFEDHLKEILWNETQIIKKDIDSVIISSDSIQKNKFIEYIKKTISYIQSKEDDLLQKFTICQKPFEEIVSYLNEKYKIDLYNTALINLTNSFFKVKVNIKKSKFYELYNITADNDIIDADQISKESFVSVLTDNDTNEKIQFNCKNGLAMKYLETINVLFDNLTGKSIESSKRFYTKGGKTLITETNYNKAKNDISDKEIDKLSSFIKDFKLL
ncbi:MULTISPECIES: hypothetical protein [unclassified Flavobacterium]|uniref:hypothetical protein n=1 Tax=unclassified Flavobacterium TaxID=196869 RepID=UPI00131D22B3|nr:MULTISPECIES: hypothetical protein [unclassified Flavobacterium]